MARRIRWQIVLALAGTLTLLGIVGTVALSAASTALPLNGSAYVEGIVGVPTQLNPLLLAADSPESERDVAALVYNGLTRMGPHGEPEPALAERWAISVDSTVYTFTLHADLRWHDATPLTAADVVWTIGAIQQADFPGDRALAEIWRNVQVTQLDARRIQCTLKGPFAPFLAATALPILPAHLWQALPVVRWGQPGITPPVVGSGPFRLERIDGTQAVLRPFEGAVQGRPAIDVLILRFFANLAAAQDALRRRDVQGIATVARVGDGAGLKSRTLTATVAALDEYTILTFNLQQPPFDSLPVRQALAAALDRDALVNQLLPGRAQRLDTPILPGSWAADPQVHLPLYDPAQAARWLEQAGWKRGSDGVWQLNDTPLALHIMVADTTPQRSLANEVARQWRAAGVQVTVDAVAPGDLTGALSRRGFEVALHAWSDVGGDPDLYALWHSSQVEKGVNYAGLADPALDQLLEQGRTITDQAERQRIYSAVQRRWVELVPSLPLFQPRLVMQHDTRVDPTGLAGSLLHGPAGRWSTIGSWSTTSAP